MFAAVPLAARIERAECRVLTDCAAAISRRNPDTDVVVLPIAGGVATFTGADSPLNKVAGLGFEGPLERDRLEVVEREFTSRGAPVQVELATLADPSIGELLTRRGYVLKGFENVLGRPLGPADAGGAAAERIVVETSGPDDFATWLDVVLTGFATPDVEGVPSHESFSREALERVVRDMAAADGLVRYLAYRDGIPAGGASMRVFAGVAQLCGAATLPEHRRLGVQTALLDARLAAARQAGCDVAVVTTQPGSKSQENAQRQRFELLYARAVLLREGAP